MASRPTVIAGNWKMHKLRDEAVAYARELTAWIDANLGDAGSHPDLQVIVAPPFTALAEVLATSPSCGVFAQTMHQADQGAFTGEVSPAMLRDVGVHGVLLGHSERRQYFNERDEALAEKVQAALAFGLRPMLCVGETIDERRGGTAEQVVGRQLRTALAGLEADDDTIERLSVAYEPVWAIGTGETATPQIAQEMHATIREVLAEVFGADAAERIPVLYGGSVKASNAAELLGERDIDGALVGGASLTVADFSGIISAAMQLTASGAAR